jgi:hypothetical protein
VAQPVAKTVVNTPLSHLVADPVVANSMVVEAEYIMVEASLKRHQATHPRLTIPNVYYLRVVLLPRTCILSPRFTTHPDSTKNIICYLLFNVNSVYLNHKR